MAERNASAGYISFGKETNKGEAVTPSIVVPYYSQSLATDISLMSDEPAFGSKVKRLQSLPGVRNHKGSMQVMAEPNSAASIFDMLMTKGNTTGSDPYTHPYTASATDPKSYTVDVSYGSYAVRFMGVEASKVALVWRDREMAFDVTVSALKSFYPREISSVTGSGPYTITLKSSGQYDSPTDGLVVGDTIQVYDVSVGSYIDCVVDSLTTTTVVVSENVSAGASGDVLSLKPASVSLSLLTPFLCPKTRYFFAADASTALTNSATASNQTRLEPGTEIAIMHDFIDENGSARSGSFDPASLPRGRYDATCSFKVYLDTPQRHRDWEELTKSALVMRAYSGASNQYELRITMNDLKAKGNTNPTESDSIILHEVDMQPNYDSSDAQMFDVKIIDARSSI